MHLGWLIPPWLIVKHQDVDGKMKMVVRLPSNEISTYQHGHLRWTYLVNLFASIWKKMAMPIRSSQASNPFEDVEMVIRFPHPFFTRPI